ncbi:YdcF family protein [Pontibacillus yanchengensis]|uniref:YdcF family protein n=1 Tax=Pontibacillus yanchengensis TaxID=462910 RepID=A0ACC7VGD0_9BACI|nr:YdcF family protein [Pontibacillus yanchengensis]MYL53838.1 YdcF family protein [Pontibacillus yanchengensis]
MDKRILIRNLFMIGFVPFCLLITLIIIYAILGREYLVIEGNPQKSEAIIVLSGSDGRLEHAVKLYKKGYGENIILTNSTEPSTTKKEAIELGVPEDAIIEEKKATSTYENALFSKDIMEKRDITSAVVVTSDYHTRRSKYTFETIFSSTDINLSYDVAPSAFQTSGKMNEYDKRIVLSEYTKLTGYWLRFLVT